MTTSSSYTVETAFHLDPLVGPVTGTASCNPGDYATGAGFGQIFLITGGALVSDLEPNPSVPGTTPTGYSLVVTNENAVIGLNMDVWAVCQTPITVAGIGVPEFGSLYAAIALAAVVYFGLSLLRTRKRFTPATM